MAKRRIRAPKRGWNVRALPNGKHLATITDPRTRERSSRCFPTHVDAEEWAKRELAGCTLDLNQMKLTRPECSFSALLRSKIDDLKATAVEAHWSEFQRVGDLAAKWGIEDLRATDVADRALDFLTKAKRRNGEPLSAASYNRYLRTLRQVAAPAVRRGHLPRDPFQDISWATEDKCLRATFTIDEVRTLVDPKRAGEFFYLPMCVLLYTGMRLNEMRHARWEWIRWAEQHIAISFEKKAPGNAKRFRTKNRRERVTSLQPELVRILKAGANLSGPIFPDLLTTSHHAAEWRFKQYLEHCGVPRLSATGAPRTPHSCRHTWTGLMIASGENTLLVQQYAGHSQTEMTKHYAAMAPTYVAQVRGLGWRPGAFQLLPPAPAAEAHEDESLPGTA